MFTYRFFKLHVLSHVFHLSPLRMGTRELTWNAPRTKDFVENLSATSFLLCPSLPCRTNLCTFMTCIFDNDHSNHVRHLLEGTTCPCMLSSLLLVRNNSERHICTQLHFCTHTKPLIQNFNKMFILFRTHACKTRNRPRT